MTKSEYIADGYRLSLQIDDRQLARAEAACVQAYAVPIGGALYDEGCAEWRALVMACAYLWVLQHAVVATKAGAKQVNITSAEHVADFEVLRQAATDAAVAIAAFRERVAADHVAGDGRPDGTGKVSDVCRIFFETNFFGFN